MVCVGLTRGWSGFGRLVKSGATIMSRTPTAVSEHTASIPVLSESGHKRLFDVQSSRPSALSDSVSVINSPFNKRLARDDRGLAGLEVTEETKP